MDDTEIIPRPEGWLKPLHPALGVIDDTAYVGIWIPSIIRDKKGHESEKTLLYIITDKGERILANDEILKGKGWRLQYKPIRFEDRWPLDDLVRYLSGDIEAPSPSEVFNGVLNKWKAYVWFADDREYYFKALWDIGTYFHILFSAYLYPYVSGVKRAGKSKDLTLHSCLGFNAIFSMNISTSSLFRLIQNAKCTVLIDESEKLSNPERAEEFRSILLAGYKVGEKVYRTEKSRKEEFIAEGFNVYGPKALANIRGLEDVLQDRCKTTTMLRCRDRSIVDREVDIMSPEWPTQRAELYRLFLAYWKEVRRWYDRLGELSEHGELVSFLGALLPSVASERSVACEPKERAKEADLELMTSRELELWRSMLALALFFYEKGVHLQGSQSSPSSLPSLVLTLALDSAKVKLTEDMTETGDTILVQVLIEIVEVDDYYPVKKIKDEMAKNFDEEQKWLTTSWVGRALTRMDFKEKRRVGTGYQYLLRRKVVEDLANRMQVELHKIDEGPPVGKTDGLLGTKMKMKALLRLIGGLEDRSGSANLDILEGLAEKELGFDGKEFGRLIPAMLREGLIVEIEDGQGVRRAGPKPPPKDETATEGPTEATCGDCDNHNSDRCVRSNSELIIDGATYARNCKGFVRKRGDEGGTTSKIDNSVQNEERWICYLCHPPTDQGSREGLRSHYRLTHDIKEVE